MEALAVAAAADASADATLAGDALRPPSPAVPGVQGGEELAVTDIIDLVESDDEPDMNSGSGSGSVLNGSVAAPVVTLPDKTDFMDTYEELTVLLTAAESDLEKAKAEMYEADVQFQAAEDRVRTLRRSTASSSAKLLRLLAQRKARLQNLLRSNARDINGSFITPGKFQSAKLNGICCYCLQKGHDLKTCLRYNMIHRKH
jgi:hypothetical protein